MLNNNIISVEQAFMCCFSVVCQWAKIIIVLERTYSHNKLVRFQANYSVTFGQSADENKRGLMVIKTSAKTRARQRKGAITNWKVEISSLFPLTA